MEMVAGHTQSIKSRTHKSMQTVTDAIYIHALTEYSLTDANGEACTKNKHLVGIRRVRHVMKPRDWGVVGGMVTL